MNQDLFCVIMAGGAGTRFWPVSRASYPKQFIDILGVGKSLLQLTIERFTQIVPKENVLIVTSAEYKDLTLKQLPQINESQILLEPTRRNTAPCIAYANFRIQQMNPNAKIVVAPSDHLILNDQMFINTIKNGFDFVSNNNNLLTLGIQPTRPDTGYGYIQFGEPLSFNNISDLCKVKAFTEKPNLEFAKFFVQSGEFYWNAGIFLWSLKSIQEAFRKHLPEVYNLFNSKSELFNTADEEDAIQQIYPVCENISIDYGVMEKADNVAVLGSHFGWSDLGTWTSLYENKNKDNDANVAAGDNILLYNTTRSVVYAPKGKLIVVQGLNNYIIADTPDALLICNKDEEQKVKNIVNDIKTRTGDKFI